MTSKKQGIAEIMQKEQNEEQKVIEAIITPERLALYDEYNAAGLNANNRQFLRDHYDVIVFNAADYDYYYGTVAANAWDALKSDGYLVFNLNGSILDTERVIQVTELFFEYKPEESRDGYYVFKKRENKLV